DLDSPSVFAAVLDSERGGRFQLEPELPYRVERRYLPGTNVLETTFLTAGGTARLTDALTLPDGALHPFRELQRRVDGLSGRVPLRWRVEPRFGYGQATPRFGRRLAFPTAAAGAEALGLCAFDAGETQTTADGWSGRFEAAEGAAAL